jgi:predicted nucleic acid-binding protein
MSWVYLDASAIAKLVIAEPESNALRDRVQGHGLISSRVAVIEVLKAVARANPAADAQPILARLSFVELDAELARLAGTTGEPSLRALDAIHVASALRLGPEIDAVITYDDRQAAAATSAGLRVEAPGADPP